MLLPSKFHNGLVKQTSQGSILGHYGCPRANIYKGQTTTCLYLMNRYYATVCTALEWIPNAGTFLCFVRCRFWQCNRKEKNI